MNTVVYNGTMDLLFCLKVELDQPWIGNEGITKDELHGGAEEETPLFDVRTLSSHFAQGVIHDAMASFQRQQQEVPAQVGESSSSSDADSGHSENNSDETNTIRGTPKQVATLDLSDQVHEYGSQVTRL